MPASDTAQPALFQGARHHLAGLGVILDQQHRTDVFRTVVAAQCLVQQFPVHRLGQVINGTERVTPRPVIDHAQHDHGYRAQYRVGLQCAQHRPAIHVRHHDVQGDGGGLYLMRKAQALFAAGRRGNAVTVFFKVTLDDLAGLRVIINDQDGAAVPGLHRYQVELVRNVGVGWRGFFLRRLGPREALQAPGW